MSVVLNHPVAQSVQQITVVPTRLPVVARLGFQIFHGSRINTVSVSTKTTIPSVPLPNDGIPQRPALGNHQGNPQSGGQAVTAPANATFTDDLRLIAWRNLLFLKCLLKPSLRVQLAYSPRSGEACNQAPQRQYPTQKIAVQMSYYTSLNFLLCLRPLMGCQATIHNRMNSQKPFVVLTQYAFLEFALPFLY